MRILLVNSEHPPLGGGAGNASANIARELVGLGEEIAILTTRHDNLPIDTTKNGVRIYRCLSYRKSVHRSTILEQLSFMLGGVTDGLAFVRRWEPDVLVTFFGVPSGPVGLAAKSFMGLPYIVSLRGGDVPGFRPYDFKLVHTLLSPLIHLVWKKANDVVANSEGLRSLAEEFAPRLPIHVIPNGVDIKRFSSQNRDWEPAHLLFTGRVVYQKGLDLLLNALSSLKDKKWHLTIVGDGPYREELQSLAHEMGIDDCVTFAGWVEKDRILHYYQKATLFVFPSRHEGMPNSVLEAMAMGLPVVASDIAGNRELVQDEKTGFLHPSRDIQRLAGALAALIDDQNLRKEMGKRSRKRIEEQFTWKQTAQKYLELLQKVRAAQQEDA
jgi:glycosyltransferase involved in cell wall biosynthesis